MREKFYLVGHLDRRSGATITTTATSDGGLIGTRNNNDAIIIKTLLDFWSELMEVVVDDAAFALYSKDILGTS